MEKENVEEIVKQRISKNEKLFTREELKIIENNFNIVTKIYLLGIVDIIWQLFWQLFE